MLKCRDLEQLSSDYIDNILPLHKRLSIKLHILLCVHCRRYLHYFKLTDEISHTVENNLIQTEKIDAVMIKIHQEK